MTVTLFDCTTGLQATDINGNLVAPIVTGASGAYSFTNLAAGTYDVHFTPPGGSGYVFTAQNAG